MEEVIKKFLSISDGSGVGYDDGYGDGSGSGSGYGSGSGDGSGSGYGSGSGSGVGYGDGDGSGIKEYNHQKVYMVDNTLTLIDSVHGNYAIGKIVNNDLTTTPCFIAKVGNFFAHGNTLKQALDEATDKYNNNKPVEERIADFVKQYPSLDSTAEHSDLYRWHNTLTGSCTFGRDAFAKDHNLDKDNGTMTVREFINLTRNAFGGDIIKQLEESYK